MDAGDNVVQPNNPKQRQEMYEGTLVLFSIVQQAKN